MRDYLQQSESRIPMSESHDLMDATVEVVSAYLSHNAVSTDQVPSFIGSVHSALSRLGGPAETTVITAERPEPAVPIKKSVFPDYIVCLEDGKKLKMLKRHLRSAYNMTPAEYRARWGLPGDYPMVAPEYAAFRSQFARQSGLGRKAA